MRKKKKYLEFRKDKIKLSNCYNFFVFNVYNIKRKKKQNQKNIKICFKILVFQMLLESFILLDTLIMSLLLLIHQPFENTD